MLRVILRTRLKGVSPDVWRRLSVPARLTLAELHAALRVAAGWAPDEACSFAVGRSWFGRPEPEHGVRSAKHVTLGSIVDAGFPRFTVHHRDDWADEDGWDQEVVLEDVLLAEGAEPAPVSCIDGARAWPPATFDGPIPYIVALAGGDVAASETWDRERTNAALAALGAGAGPGPPAKVGRSSACPCGSGRKYQQRCLVRDDARVTQGVRDSDAARMGPPEPDGVLAALTRAEWAASRTKAGRNSACPCGSGRKYKQCCLARDDARVAEGVRDSGAARMGPPTLDAGLAALTRARWTALRAKPRSLLPATPATEMRMHEGYALRDRGDGAAACDSWWEVWKHVRSRVHPESVGRWDSEGLLAGECSIRTWTRDFLEVVQTAGASSPAHAEMGVVYARELLETFPRESYAFQLLVCARLLFLVESAGRPDELAELAVREYMTLVCGRIVGVPEERLPEARPLLERLRSLLVGAMEGDAWLRARLLALEPDDATGLCELVEGDPDLANAMAEIGNELERRGLIQPDA